MRNNAQQFFTYYCALLRDQLGEKEKRDVNKYMNI